MTDTPTSENPLRSVIKISEYTDRVMLQVDPGTTHELRCALSYDEAEGLHSELRTILANRRGYERMMVRPDQLQPGDLLFERRELAVTNLFQIARGYAVEVESSISDVTGDIYFEFEGTVSILRVIQ